MADSDVGQRTNLEHIKGYAEFHYQMISKASSGLESRMLGAIALAGVMLKLAGDVPTIGTLSQVLRIAECLLFVGAVGSCLRGLMAEPSCTVAPRFYRENQYYEDENDPEGCKRDIADSIMEAAEESSRKAMRKAKYLNGSVWAISLGILGMGLSVCLSLFI
jgi:hypothetical protein